MKTYGLIMADNGSAMYISGVSDNRWGNDALHDLGNRFRPLHLKSPEDGYGLQPD